MSLPVYTGQDVCRMAMMDAMLLGAGATIDESQAQDIMNKVNRVIDNWNADGRASYADVGRSGVLTPLLSPHTIGPTGTFVVTQRPETVDAVSIVDTTVSPNVSITCTLRDAEWYANLSVPDVTGQIAVDVYYEAAWPNGNFWLWPVPTVAYTLNWWSRQVLAQLLLTDTFSLPPGYLDALCLTVAEDLCPMFEQDVPPSLERKAREARARMFGANTTIPTIGTCDAGMPDGSSSRSGSSWNYQTGLG